MDANWLRNSALGADWSKQVTVGGERSSGSRGRLATTATAVRVHVGQLPREAVYLVPLRLFLGLGWTRAGVEKLMKSGWRDGSALRSFLDEQTIDGMTVPFYAPAVGLLEDLATQMGVLVMSTELVIGTAILCGVATSRALLIAIFLNVNFILAGETNPSVFYIVVALVLLAGRGGDLLGWDGIHRPVRRSRFAPLAVHRTVGIAAATGAVLLLPFVTTLSPAAVIHDPAAVLALLSGLVAAGAAVRLAQGDCGDASSIHGSPSTARPSGR